MVEDTMRFSDADLAEFKEIIVKKIEKAPGVDKKCLHE
jgi:hypothetical protein